jgi:hypothetical protein
MCCAYILQKVFIKLVLFYWPILFYRFYFEFLHICIYTEIWEALKLEIYFNYRIIKDVAVDLKLINVVIYRVF